MEKIIILNGSYSDLCDELVIAMECVQQPEVKRKGNMPVGQVKLLRVPETGGGHTEWYLSSAGDEGLDLPHQSRSPILLKSLLQQMWFWHSEA